MIYKLRKNHLFIWKILAVILPLLVVVSYLVTPAFPIIAETNANKKLFPVLASVQETGNYIINLRLSAATAEMQLEITRKEYADHETVLLYINSDVVNEWQLIGTLSNDSVQVFTLSMKHHNFPVQLKMVNLLHKEQEIITLN